MFFNDHNPPHFHVNYQGYDAIIEIENGIVTGQMPRKALKLIYEWLDLHKKDLLKNWQKMRQRKPLSKIEPLN
jgi:predicted RNase H-like HicB family nuclease